MLSTRHKGGELLRAFRGDTINPIGPSINAGLNEVARIPQFKMQFRVRGHPFMTSAWREEERFSQKKTK